jgi:hypothetical protein
MRVELKGSSSGLAELPGVHDVQPTTAT